MSTIYVHKMLRLMFDREIDASEIPQQTCHF